MVDAGVDIDRLIERRSNGHAERAREALYMESVHRYHARRRRENVAAWYAYFMDQADRVERAAAQIAAEHRRRAEQLMTDEQEGAT